eukprot:g9310.t1
MPSTRRRLSPAARKARSLIEMGRAPSECGGGSKRNQAPFSSLFEQQSPNSPRQYLRKAVAALRKRRKWVGDLVKGRAQARASGVEVDTMGAQCEFIFGSARRGRSEQQKKTDKGTQGGS